MVLWLQQPAHHIQHSCLANSLRSIDIIACERCIACLQEMAPRRRDQTRYNTDEIVMHVARIAQCRGGSGHDGADETVGLLERGFLDVECICCNPAQGAIVEDDHRIRVLRKSAERKKRVVRLHYHVSCVFANGVWEDGVSLYELFGEAIIEAFEEEGAESRSCPAGDGME